MFESRSDAEGKRVGVAEILLRKIIRDQDGPEDLLRCFWKNEQKYPKGVLKL
jgi:hypothetical protein